MLFKVRLSNWTCYWADLIEAVISIVTLGYFTPNLGMRILVYWCRRWFNSVTNKENNL